MAICDNIYPNGLGSSLGNELLTREPLYTSATVYYVHATDGDDTNAGTERKQPLATLAAAVTAASDDDIIVLLDGHAETLTSAQTVSERLTIVGEGRSNSKPTVKLTNNQSAASLLTITGNNVELRNIWFEEESQANTQSRIVVTGTDFRMVDCYVECNENDNDTSGGVVSFAAGWANARIENTTFISTATDSTDGPAPAVDVDAGNQFEMDGVVFDGGTAGFLDGVAFETGTVAVLRLKCTNISLLRGADAAISGSATGFFMPTTTTGSARVFCQAAA